MVEERWTGNRRSDGLKVAAGVDGYVIMPAGAGLTIDRCPCCDELFPRDDRGLRGARLVADMLYPMMAVEAGANG